MRIVDFQKYRDIAYLNDTGRAWLRKIYRNDIWNEWEAICACLCVDNRAYLTKRGGAPNKEWLPKDTAKRIFIEAIWYFGFMGIKNVRPLTGRAKGADGGVSERAREFMYLDQWLEVRVRPMLPK